MTPIDDIATIPVIETPELDDDVARDTAQFVGILLLDEDAETVSATPETVGTDGIDVDIVSAGDELTSSATVELPDGVDPRAAIVGTCDGDVLWTDGSHLDAVGLAGDDVLISTVAGSRLYGGDGYDLLQSEMGGDTLTGGADPDLFLLWIDSMSAPSRIADFDADDMLVLVGDIGVVELADRVISVDGRTVATFASDEAAANAMFWLA